MSASQMSDKFIRKYMRVAREFGTYENPCYSRKIGAVIVRANKILGIGYNGPPSGTPHPDSEVYLREYFWDQLRDGEKDSLRLELGLFNADDYEVRESFVARYTGSGTCPRRLVKAKSGERPELCSCVHAERNAITNAAQDCACASMLCWCGVPCLQCTGAVINAGIVEVHCVREEVDYHDKSRWLLKHSGVAVYEYGREWFGD